METRKSFFKRISINYILLHYIIQHLTTSTFDEYRLFKLNTNPNNPVKTWSLNHICIERERKNLYILLLFTAFGWWTWSLGYIHEFMGGKRTPSLNYVKNIHKTSCFDRLITQTEKTCCYWLPSKLNALGLQI